MTLTTNDQDETVNPLSRRKVFTMCSIGLLGAAGLAACSSDSDSEATDSTTAAATEAAEATAAATTEAAAAGGASIVALADIPVASAVSVTVDGKPVIVAQPTKGEAVAFSAACPHQFVTVAVSGKQLKCPAHGSTFEIATGKNLAGPAAGKPLTAISVKVVDGEVVQA
jgi:cytochrome b6-f complex iron-sulfur subunit